MSARAQWTSAVMPAAVVPQAVGTELALETRARLERRGYVRYGLLDRGSYDVVEAPELPELAAALAGLASAVTGRAADIVSARALRLVPGDYILTRHDRVHERRPLELVVDLSPASVPGAEVHWRHRGQVFFVMPSSPGTLAIVERGPTVLCNHTYVSRRAANEVVRLVLVLA